MSEPTVLRLTRITPELLEPALNLYRRFAVDLLDEANATLERGLGYVISGKSGQPVAVSPLPNIDSQKKSDGTLYLTRPIIHPDLQFKGLACILVPMPIAYGRLYLTGISHFEMRGSPDINKALSNMGFSEISEKIHRLPIEQSYRSAAELVRLCGTQIARTEGPAGKLAVISQNPGMLLSYDNKNALEELARTGEVVQVADGKEAERSYIFGRSGHCSD